MSGKIENLLQYANSSDEADSSVNSAKRRFSNEFEARSFYTQTKSKLLDLAEWNAKSTGVNYELFDESGKICADKTPEKGKFIRLSLPAAGKYDWVKIIEIYEAANEFVITVQPSYDPTKTLVDKTVISHFYSHEARNNFCLQRDETEVIFYVIGTGEKQNAADTNNLFETVRNVAAANFGYFFGAQKGVWKDFCKNFLED